MFSSEIKETIYIAVACFLAASVLALVAFVMDIRSDLASVKNNEIVTQIDMTGYAKFNKYQDAILYGEDVMAAILEFANTDIAVYVNHIVDERNVVHKTGLYLDKNAYIANPDKFSYEALELGKKGAYTSPFTEGLKRDVVYYSYLVFGTYGEDNIKESPYIDSGSDINYSDVTGIVIKRVGWGRHYNEPDADACGCGVPICECPSCNGTVAKCHASEIHAQVNAVRNGSYTGNF